jgi:sugar/nucleoside kinase (ribokinase family)
MEIAFAEADGVIVVDQVNEPYWGVVNQRVQAKLEQLAASHPKKLVLIDSRRRLGEFRFGVLKGNRAEVLGAASLDEHDPLAVERAAAAMVERTKRPVFTTLGEEGILIRLPGGASCNVPAVAVQGPIDIVGAGDSVTAGLVASLLAGASESEAAQIACLVASITIQQIGTTGVATPEQVLNRRTQVDGTTIADA